MSIRAVIDTNVVVARFRSSSKSSPGREVFSRWGAGEFALLYQEDILVEYAELLLRHGVSVSVMKRFIQVVRDLGEFVDIEFFHVSPYPDDLDDVIFLLCALNGEASHLVSHDVHLASLADAYENMEICSPLQFLRDLRSGS